MKRENKEEIVNGLGKDFIANGTYYLVDYKQMRVSQSVELRKILRKNAYSYKVVKNRLALRALQESAPEPLKPFFRKTTAIAFAEKDPIGLAKAAPGLFGGRQGPGREGRRRRGAVHGPRAVRRDRQAHLPGRAPGQGRDT